MKPPARTKKSSRAPTTADDGLRADARRNLDAVLEAAKAVFADSGVDAPVREIAARANVGVATLYRNFPHRADLIAAVLRREIDACAAAAPALAREYEPSEALARWLHRFTSLVATKRGLGETLASRDPAFEGLAAHFHQHLDAALKSLLDAAVRAGQIRADVESDPLLRAVGRLSTVPGPDGLGRRMVDLLIDGLRYGASAPHDGSKRRRDSRRRPNER